MSEFNLEPSAKPAGKSGRSWPYVLVTASFFVFLCLIALSPALFGQQQNSGPKGGAADDGQYLGTIQALNEFIRNNYVDPVDAQKLYEGALKGMFEALEDPYSLYLDVEEMRKLTDTTTGEFGGVGMYIDKQRNPEGKVMPTGYVEVVSPIEDTPAFREGMQSGDLIVEIDGKSTAELSLDESVAKLRGPVGSKVEIRVFRGQTMDFRKTITRDKIEIPTVKAAMIGDVAYLRIIQFTPLTVEQLRLKLTDFNQKGYKALIVDLRNNPGGVLDGAVEIADLFFDDGILVSTKGRVPYENRVYNATKGSLVDRSIPIVCLVNDGSASASEILAGALKDRGRALFLGTKTYGKGSVQTVRAIGDQGFRMTIARYYTPANISIDKIGISPDMEVKEDPLTKEEEYSFLRFQDLDMVSQLADRYGKDLVANKAAIMAVVKEKGLVLPENIVVRMVRNEMDRRNNVTRDYDLDYDKVLQQALQVIRNNEVEQRIKSRVQVPALPQTADSGEKLPAPVLK